MSNLSDIYKHFVCKMNGLENRYSNLHTIRNNFNDFEVKLLSEGLISDAWQTWNYFCRQMIISSCRGAVGISGTLYLSRNFDNSWQRLGYEARQYASKHKVNSTTKHQGIYQDPTWGDISKFVDIIMGLAPTNRLILLGGFGLPLNGPKHMQLVRNACQHKNVETIKKLTTIRLQYTSYASNSPSLIIWEVDISKNMPAYLSWLDDMEIIAQNACQ